MIILTIIKIYNSLVYNNATSLWLGDGLSGRTGSRGADAQNRLSRPFYRSPSPTCRHPGARAAVPGHRGNRAKIRGNSFRGRPAGGGWVGGRRASSSRATVPSGCEKDFGRLFYAISCYPTCCRLQCRRRIELLAATRYPDLRTSSA